MKLLASQKNFFKEKKEKKPTKQTFLLWDKSSKSHSMLLLESFWLGKMSVQFHEVNKHCPGNYSVSQLFFKVI